MTTKLFAFCLYFDRKRNRDLDLTCSRDIIDIPNTKILMITGHATSFSIFAFYFLCSESMTLKLLLTQYESCSVFISNVKSEQNANKVKRPIDIFGRRKTYHLRHFALL